MIVINNYNVSIYYEAAIELMNDDLREALASELAPCTEQEFFSSYCTAHAAKYGEPWVLDTPNPCY